MRSVLTLATVMTLIALLLVHLLSGQDSGTSLASGSSGPDLEIRSQSKQPHALPETAMREFVRDIESGMAEGDWRRLNTRFDWESFVDKILTVYNPSSKKNNEFRANVHAGFMKGVREGGWAAICRGVGSDGTYRFVGFRSRDGATTALFRCTSTSGLDYHEYLLSSINGRIVANDIYVIGLGEYYSASMQRLFLPTIRHITKTAPSQLNNPEDGLPESLRSLISLQRSLAMGDPVAVLRTYYTLPAELREEKVTLVIRYRAAVLLESESEIGRAKSALESRFPGDAALTLLEIDRQILKKNYVNAIAAVDRLEKRIGGDAYLDVIRAEILGLSGDTASAVSHAHRAVAALPKMTACHLTLIGILLEQNDHASLYEALTNAETMVGAKAKDIRNEPMYRGFAQSAHGQRWLQEHGFR